MAKKSGPILVPQESLFEKICQKFLVKKEDSVTWRSVDGAEVVLRGARLEALSEIERGALRLVALQRLAVLLPGVTLAKPKGIFLVRRSSPKP
ncbi:hypothetical protein ANCDUO_15147 [Ancylostoma duodenale]|uniref:Uncharacterized protein n=1 Tax=Ancylostoma duodenale TaxID=51022 RepID=A0A0C2G715_9BILA|nr:hypothetical protein ANCDUO_15147 [Ancylostoma duodenale]